MRAWTAPDGMLKHTFCQVSTGVLCALAFPAEASGRACGCGRHAAPRPEPRGESAGHGPVAGVRRPPRRSLAAWASVGDLETGVHGRHAIKGHLAAALQQPDHARRRRVVLFLSDAVRRGGARQPPAQVAPRACSSYTVATSGTRPTTRPSGEGSRWTYTLAMAHSGLRSPGHKVPRGTWIRRAPVNVASSWRPWPGARGRGRSVARVVTVRVGLTSCNRRTRW